MPKKGLPKYNCPLLSASGPCPDMSTHILNRISNGNLNFKNNNNDIVISELDIESHYVNKRNNYKSKRNNLEL